MSSLTERVSFRRILQPCETHTPAVLNTKIDGKDGYSTNDLMLPHPTKPGYYKVHGRADDQIMLSTGEKASSGITTFYTLCPIVAELSSWGLKTNPGPIGMYHHLLLERHQGTNPWNR
jgi:hypothetical protein